MNMKESYQKFLLVIFGTLVGCIISYGVLKIWAYVHPLPRKIVEADYETLKAQLDYNPRSIFKFEPDLSYMLKENFEGIRYSTKNSPHYTNSRSLLGKFEIDPNPKIKKILFLGDSVAYGYGVAYENTLGVIMQELVPRNVQVLNGSCPGWSTYQEIMFFNTYLSEIDWEKTLIVFSLNDLVKFEWVYDTSDRQLTLLGRPLKMSPEMEQVGGLSGITKVKRSLQLRKKQSDFKENATTGPLARHNNTALHAWIEDAWEKYEEEVLKMLTFSPFKHRIEKHKLILVAIPSLPQIESALLGADRQIVFFPQDQLKTFCSNHQINFIDTSPAFLTNDLTPNWTLAERFLDDLHLSEVGHYVVAEYLWSQLKKEF